MSGPGYRGAIAHGDGWYGFNQSAEEAAAVASGYPDRFDALEISVTPRGSITPDRAARFADLGMTRLILLTQPPGNTQPAADGMRQFIETTAADLKL